MILRAFWQGLCTFYCMHRDYHKQYGPLTSLRKGDNRWLRQTCMCGATHDTQVPRITSPGQLIPVTDRWTYDPFQ